MAEVIERKRLGPPADATSLAGPAPSNGAELSVREAWSKRFVARFLEATGGDMHPDGGPAGHRWRMEYFDCVRDPQAFEKYAKEEIRAYEENDNGEGN